MFEGKGSFNVLDMEPQNAPSHFQRPDRITDPLYVVTTVFNSPRYRSRWKLYQDFVKRCDEAGAKVVTVEVAFGEREFAVPALDHGRHQVIGLRTSHELWHKERALNLGVQRLPSDWKYVAWIDADVAFMRDDWADETTHMLQHYPVIQMWSNATDLSPDFEPIQGFKSFAWTHREGLPTKVGVHGQYYPYGKAAGGSYPHPGYAWAMRRDAWDALGGLIDYSVLGSADYHMAHALIGQMDWTLFNDYSPGYKKMLREWEARAVKHIRYNLGVMKGGLVHYWHGAKIDRRYRTRPQILTAHQYDPAVDLKPDWQGLYQLTDRSYGLRDDLRTYFHERNEDGLQ